MIAITISLCMDPSSDVLVFAPRSIILIIHETAVSEEPPSLKAAMSGLRRVASKPSRDTRGKAEVREMPQRLIATTTARYPTDLGACLTRHNSTRTRSEISRRPINEAAISALRSLRAKYPEIYPSHRAYADTVARSGARRGAARTYSAEGRMASPEFYA